MALPLTTASETFFKHGKKGTPEYSVWALMRDRCNNPNNKKFDYYGGKGVSVCERWDDFTLFLDDMGHRPSRLHTIDRIDSGGNYDPDNCKWSTRKEQVRNRSNTKMLTVDGATKPMAEWAEIYEIPYQVVNKRVWRGWDHKRALTQKIKGE